MMRKLDIAVDSETEKNITPEDRWISTHSRWTDDDDSDAGPSAPVADEDMEVDDSTDDDPKDVGDEETEESEEDD